MNSNKKTLQFISHSNSRFDYLEGIKAALKGGCKWIQLRIKTGTDDEVRLVAQEAVSLCRAMKSTLIIDDRVLLAKEVGADGVHLGKNDMTISEARKILGDKCIIGGTANTIEDIRQLYKDGADYIGCGPFRFTTTKEKLAPVIGIEGYQALIDIMKVENINIPLIAIGGIKTEDIPALIDCGIDGVAISGTILNAANPVKETSRILSLLNAKKSDK